MYFVLSRQPCIRLQCKRRGGRRRNSAPTLEPPPLQGKSTDRLMGRTVGVQSTSVGGCRRLHECRRTAWPATSALHAGPCSLSFGRPKITLHPEEGVEDGENSATPGRASGSERQQPVWRWGSLLQVPAPSVGVPVSIASTVSNSTSKARA